MKLHFTSTTTVLHILALHWFEGLLIAFSRSSRDWYLNGVFYFQIHSPALTLEHEQRILVEAIVSILPPEKTAISCSFLFGLLRAAVVLETTLACRLDLERRIGLQLEQATLDDLLIPSANHNVDTLFDVDAVQRILNCFMQQDGAEDVDVR